MEHILYGPRMSGDLLGGANSLGEYLVNVLTKNPSDVVLVHSITGEEVTASQLLENSLLVAKALDKHGVQTGDRVGIIAENSLEFVYICYGTILLGAIICPINYILIEREIVHLFNISQPKIVFASNDTIDKMLNSAPEVKSIEAVIVIGTDARCLSFELFLNSVRNQATTEFTCDPQNVATTSAAILPSSGTTGVPKAIELTQMNILSYIKSVCEVEDKVGSVIIPPNTFASIVAFAALFTTILNRQKLIVIPSFEEELVLKTVEKFRTVGLVTTPAMIFFLGASPLVDKYDLSCLKVIFAGSGVIREDIVKAIMKRQPFASIIHAYGLSENLCVTIQQSMEWSNSIGKLMSDVTAKVVDVESRKTLGPNKPGEFLIKSCRLMKGYYNDPLATQNAFDADGFLCTGDLVYYNENEEFFFVERMKEVIKYKNFNICPTELELLLMEHPKVIDACVVGKPDAEADELATAFVVINEDCIDADELCKFVAERVSPSKYLRGGIKIIPEIPKNFQGKPLRRVLKQSLT